MDGTTGFKTMVFHLHVTTKMGKTFYMKYNTIVLNF